MSISKRFLTFVFTAIIALSFLAVGESVAQQYSGLDMPQGYYVGPELKAGASREEKRAWTQKYGTARKRVSAGNNKVKAVLAAGGDVKADPEAREYLEKIVFPAMTQTDPTTLSALGLKRQDFLKNFLGKGVTGVARAKMIDFTVETLQSYCINSTLHPSARLNAVVLLSQLTDRPLISRQQAPLASGKAFVVLQKIFSGENEKQFPEYLKIAAFTGMKNQLEMNAKSGQPVNANVKAPLVQAVMKILPVEVDREKDAAGYWKKRQAVQLAGVLKDTQTVPAMLAILTDEVSSFDLKLDVVRSLSKMGAVGDAKANGAAAAAICKFAAMAVGGEATKIVAAREKMIRDGILFGDVDLMQSREPIDFQPEGEDEFGNGRNDFGIDDRERTSPLIELPNYQLNQARNRIRAVAIFCPQAIGVLKKQGLDAKAEALSNGTLNVLSSLLEKSSVGLLDLGERTRDGEPTPQERDRDRETSYVDQMAKLCQDSAKSLNDKLEGYSTE